MKAPFSPYLQTIAPGLKQLVAILRKRYDYVSVLSTDSSGFAVRISGRTKSVSRDSLCTERGTVVRVYRNGLYSEAALNTFDPEHPEVTAELLFGTLDRQLALLAAVQADIYETAILPDAPETVLFEAETGSLPADTDLPAMIERFSALAESVNDPVIIDCTYSAQSVHVNKLFLTENRDLRQSYVFSEGSVVCLASNGERTDVGYAADSKRIGPELFDDMSYLLDGAIKSAKDLLKAEPVEPGEYEIIANPEIAGLIAHEAFGHGVEMDMFVKGRALGSQYIGQRVGSDITTMHEGASCSVTCAAYAFDDEGTPAGDVIEIDHGILRTGICDALSALRLGTVPTGNGRRQNYEHKVYTRMTNTVFEAGESTPEEMIASVKKGYLLDGVSSGMEDPKHWGIQCICSRGYEIIDGKLTGKVVAPVVLTGYVPDLLGSISMISNKQSVFGSGYCGKGYKEYVKVADGGPYLKAKAVLG